MALVADSSFSPVTLLAAVALSMPVTALAEDCTGWVRQRDVLAGLDAAAAVVDDGAAFVTAVDEAEKTLVCMKQKAEPATAARVHLFLGARALALGDDELANASWAAATRLAPELDLSAFPESVAALVRAAAVERPSGAEASAPSADLPTIISVLDADGALWFDGAAASARPHKQPTLFQVLDTAGSVQHTVWVRPGQMLPKVPRHPDSVSSDLSTLKPDALRGAPAVASSAPDNGEQPMGPTHVGPKPSDEPLVAEGPETWPQPTCAGWVRRRDVETALTETTPLWAEPESFVLGVQRAELVLDCMRQKAEPAFATQVHTFLGLSSFQSGDSEAAAASFRSAKRVTPDASLPAFAAETPEVAALWTAAVPTDSVGSETEGSQPPADLAVVVLALDSNSTLSFDGAPQVRPFEQPTIYQVLDEGGAVVLTRYLRAADSLVWTDAGSRAQAWVNAADASAVASADTDLLRDDDALHLDLDNNDDEGDTIEVPRRDDDRSSFRVGMIPAGGGAAVVLVSGALMAVHHNRALDSYELATNATSWADYTAAEQTYTEERASIDTWRKVGGIGLAVAGIGAATLFIDDQRVIPWVAPGSAGITIRMGGAR